jgi:DNA-binding transcriptional MerR regulator
MSIESDLSAAAKAPVGTADAADAAHDAGADASLDGCSRLFTITELAAEFDITPRAIRFYEDMGLLSPAREGRNRVYTHRDRTRLKLTLRGKRLGLSLQEIKQLVDMYDAAGADTAPQLKAFLEVLAQHRRQLEQQLEDIEVTLEEISQHEERCRALLAQR